MNKQDIENIFIGSLEKESHPFNKPSESDWRNLSNLSNKFGCIFGKSFKDYTDLISKYILPGSLNVATEDNNGDDTISIVYEHEMRYGRWNPSFMPFFQIDNGDYFCLNLSECSDSSIYYYNHETEVYEEYMENFEIWIEDFERFYSGE